MKELLFYLPGRVLIGLKDGPFVILLVIVPFSLVQNKCLVPLTHVSEQLIGIPVYFSLLFVFVFF